MKAILQSLTLFAVMGIAVACGESKKETAGTLGDKKAELQKLKGESTKLSDQIKKLEDDIAKLDTGADKSSVAKLVHLTPVATGDFSHYIDLQGKIDADNISYVTPRGMGGQVREILVQKGQPVRKGQLLIRLDDAIQRQNLIAAKQGLEGIKTQIGFAKDLYQRRQNLWKQNIGSEVELLSAKNNVESLENQLKAAEENVKVVAEQLNTANVYADLNGIADEVNIKVGEFFNGSTMSGIRIVNTSSLKVVADIPENYMARVGRGSRVEVSVPDVNKKYSSTITYSGASINNTTRGFTIEAKLPGDGVLKPNQLATVRILDYNAPTALTVPVNVIQTDESGKYVFVASKENGKMVARKKPVAVGMVYGENAEIKVGLSGGEQLVTEGYQTLYDGQAITTSTK